MSSSRTRKDWVTSSASQRPTACDSPIAPRSHALVLCGSSDSARISPPSFGWSSGGRFRRTASGYFLTLASTPLMLGLVVLLVAVPAVVIWGLTNLLTKLISQSAQRRKVRSMDGRDQRSISSVDGAGVVHASIDDVFADGTRDVR